MRNLRDFLQRIGPGWMLVLGFVALFSIYEGGHILHQRPYPFHLWRQTDCLSLTANYHAGQPFLQPAIHAQIADGGESGLSAGEFPIIYWAMGQLWKLTGPSEFAYRLFGILLHFLATWAMFSALRRLLGSPFWAITTALLLYTSPVIVYYSMGFLTDVPALDLVLIGWYFLVRFGQEQRQRWWVWAMACFALATLLKVSAGISLVALMALLALATVAPKAFGDRRRLLPSAGLGWATIGAALLAIMAWYLYAEGYNDRHNGRYTFNNIWPIWEMSPEEVRVAWDWARQVLVFQLFDTTVWVVLGLALLALAIHVRRIPWPVALLNGLLIVGVALYTVLWFHALDRHDYYYINPLIAALVLWATFLWWLQRDHPRLFHARWAKGAFALLLLFNVAYAANNMRMRYTVYGPIDKADLLPIYHEHEFEVWNANDYYGLRSALDLGPALDSLGVPADAKVIYLDDITINGSLYLMGRKGFTHYGHDWSDPETFERLERLGARYLIFAEDRWLEDPVVAPLLKTFVARHRWAYIFDLKDQKEREERELFLGAEAPELKLEHRMDTVACPRGWCFLPNEYPLEVRGLPTYGKNVMRAEVIVRGSFTGEGRGEVLLMLGEDDQEGQIALSERAFTEGPFEFTFQVPRRPPGVRNTLFVWNRSGRTFRLEGLELEVRRWVAE